MKVSVIIPVYNEESVIGECLTSLKKQSLNNLEIIVVDDGSWDGTKNNLIQIQEKIPELQILFSNHLGAGGARNLGVSKSAGEILVFVDADMTFDKDFIKNLIKPIDGEIKGTFSKEEYVSNWNNLWARCWNLNEGWEDKLRHPKNYPNSQAVFRAILKSEFVKVGGFELGGYNDDWSLSKKLGYQAEAARGAVFYHKNPDNLIEVFKQAKWIGKRKYKLGYLGYLVALIRSSLPASLLIGFYKSLISFNFAFPIFKVVYDLGIFIGVLEYISTRKGAK